MNKIDETYLDKKLKQLSGKETIIKIEPFTCRLQASVSHNSSTGVNENKRPDPLPKDENIRIIIRDLTEKLLKKKNFDVAEFGAAQEMLNEKFFSEKVKKETMPAVAEIFGHYVMEKIDFKECDAIIQFNVTGFVNWDILYTLKTIELTAVSLGYLNNILTLFYIDEDNNIKSIRTKKDHIVDVKLLHPVNN